MRQWLGGLWLAGAAALCGTPALAAEIKVLTAGAFKPVLLSQLPEFERRTGHKVTLQNDTAGMLVRRIKAGEAFDLVVLTQSALGDLGRSGEVVTASVVPLARVGIGLAVKTGTPLPDIGSTGGFRQTLLAARRIAFMDPAGGSTSGIYLTRLFERLGIAGRIQPKAVLVVDGLSAERLISGEADIAIQQMSELIVVPGVTVVGALPAEVQSETVYGAAIGSRATNRAAAEQLLSALQDPRLRPVLEARGMQAP